MAGNSNLLSPSGNVTMILLVVLDVLGVFLIFNLSHGLIVVPSLILSWKLVLIMALIFLFNYLMDLYTFDSILSQMGMVERSFIAVLLTGISVALMVYIIGPTFIGGFVGRGVLATSLVLLWFWTLSVRLLLNHWIKRRRREVAWLVITDRPLLEFIAHFRSLYAIERLLVLTQDGSEIGTSDPQIETAGSWHDLERVLWERGIAGIIVCSPERMPETLIDRLLGIRISGVRIYTLNDFYEKYLTRLPVFNLDQHWLAMAHGFELIHNPIGLRFKRYIDILLAVVFGGLLSPVLLTAAVLVVITSGFPVLYRQTRIGENGKAFTAYKFRTMVVDAEADGARFASRDDPRTTPFGRFMRKFRLDELPQLWNVLRGDMSFIGPRPERPEFITQLQRNVPYYSLRHIVKPGITGWAQVMYGYGDSDSDAVEKLQYDLFYIKNYSLLLDISIMIKTIKVVLFGTGR